MPLSPQLVPLSVIFTVTVYIIIGKIQQRIHNRNKKQREGQNTDNIIEGNNGKNLCFLSKPSAYLKDIIKYYCKHFIQHKEYCKKEHNNTETTEG
jgi:hypothetical protein